MKVKLPSTITSSILVFLATGALVNAAIPIDSERRLQSRSSTRVLIEVQSIQKKNQHPAGRFDLEVKASVIAVEKSATGLKKGDSLTLCYWLPN